MKLTVDSDEPLERVLEVVGSLYGVRLSIDGVPAGPARPSSGRARTATRPTRGRRSAKKAVAKRSPARRGRGAAADPAAVRAWAREQGLPVRERGRVPAEIVQAYTESARR